MSTPKETFVIVGAALAGAKAAETLRGEGFDGRVVLIGAEDELPYERPPLSKEYLRGEAGREKVYVHEEGFYDEHEIELLRGRVGPASTQPPPSWRSTTASGCATTACC
jgi:3-phenylpropionate/trans-cinnamate dioxygenase ferredoxin reductase component